jgi:hypothetical protein
MILVLVRCGLGPYSNKLSLKMKNGIEGKDGVERNDHGIVLKEQT